MSTDQGADELRMRALLVAHEVGPDAAPPKPAAPAPAAPLPSRRLEEDWWDAVYKDDQADRDTFTGNTPVQPASPHPEDVPADADGEPEADDEPDEQPEPTARWRSRKARPEKPSPEPSSRPAPGAPRTAWDTRPPAPRQSLVDAWGRVPPRLKWLAYHASAAAFGWWLGWVGWATNTAAWYAAGHWTTPSAWVLYGLGVCTCALYSKTRSWRLPVAWMAAVPVSSLVVGVLLYAPHP